MVLKSAFERKAQNKAEDLIESVKGIHGSKVVEYCFHLCDPDANEPLSFTKKRSASYYPGVNKKYFDARKVEYKSLHKYREIILKQEINGIPEPSTWNSF